MNTQNGRGVLTPEIKEKAREFLGEEIDQTELRLYPYFDYCWKNGGQIDRAKITKMEEIIIERREKQGHIIWGAFGFFAPTRDFYNYVQNILALGYVVFAGG